MKCELCKQAIEETFLKKPLGTAVKDAKGKKRWVCSACQKGRTKQEILGLI
jgi:hypothetical protein